MFKAVCKLGLEDIVSKGVAENQKSEGTRCNASVGRDVLMAATLLGIDLVIAVPLRQTICG